MIIWSSKPNTMVVHHSGDVRDGITGVTGHTTIRALCRFDQTSGNTAHLFTTDWSRVACQSCIEWRHA